MWGVPMEDLSNQSNETFKRSKITFVKNNPQFFFFAKDEIYFIQGHIWTNSAKGKNSRVKIGDRRANIPKMSF